MITTKIVSTVLLICLLQSLPVFGNSTELSETMKIISEYHGYDLKKMLEMYNMLKAGHQGFGDLFTQIESELVVKNAEILAHDISCKNVSKQMETYTNIYKNYDKEMVKRIFDDTVDEIVAQNNLLLLKDLLSHINEPENSEFFDAMLGVPPQAYSDISNGNATDKYEFLQKFSFMLNILRKHNTYSKKDQNLKSNVDKIINVLPKNVMLLILQRFCLKNVEHSNYIYTSLYPKEESTTHNIWLWNDNDSMDSTGYIKAEFQEVDSADGEEFKVILQGIRFQVYYAMDPKTREVVGLKAKLNNMWNIKYLDNDRVVLSQNGFNLCAAENENDEKRRIKGVNSSSSLCQWRVVDCIFRS